MNFQEFSQTQTVDAFTNWLTQTIPEMPVHLNVPRSKFVPVKIEADVQFGRIVPSFYCWKAPGMTAGDWAETCDRVNQLSEDLRAALRRNGGVGDSEAALSACCAIVKWGGDRNGEVGATKFLENLNDGICSYLSSVNEQLDLAKADLDDGFPGVTGMNSMLTKVHAFLATDGLPIYDSRVAAAIAAFVEMWRRQELGRPLPALLTFPEAGGSAKVERKLSRVFEDVRHPGRLNYGGQNTAVRWAEAKVRLGWILSLTLKKSKTLFQSTPNRMKSFEASLFMVGYDLKCLKRS